MKRKIIFEEYHNGEADFHKWTMKTADNVNAGIIISNQVGNIYEVITTDTDDKPLTVRYTAESLDEAKTAAEKIYLIIQWFKYGTPIKKGAAL